MKCKVLTPESELFNAEVRSVKVPGVTGRFEILKNHAPIVSALTEGEIKVTKEDGNVEVFGISRGFVEVINNEVSLLVTTVALSE